MPSSCGLGLKFTVGTAVSVSPLGLLGGSSGSVGAAAQGQPNEEEEEKRGHFNFFICTFEILLIKIWSYVL